MNKNKSFFDLVDEAQEMLLDRPEIEQDLIYHVAKMDNEERTAIILAYQSIRFPRE